MKKLTMFLLSLICWDSSLFAQIKLDSSWGQLVLTNCDTIITTGVAVLSPPAYRIERKAIIDTIHEPILVSTRVPGFVRTEMALAVRLNGICIKHLDCSGRELKYPVYVWDCDNERKRRVK